MEDLRNLFKRTIEKELVPFLAKFNFEYKYGIHEFSETHDTFMFKKHESYLEIYHMGFNPKDAPWSFIILLGKKGFKKTTTQFDSIPLWYLKQKIAPPYDYQREAIKLTFNEYDINNDLQIRQSIENAIFELSNFCNDFLTGDFVRFDRIRQINYLEYLVQTQVISESNWFGLQKIVMKSNEEIE